MADSQIEEIKNKLNILDVVGGYVTLTKTGINYRGLCPFHSEKTPSFFVSPTRQTWHCFGCGEGYSIFDFVMKIEGIEFGDALKILANRAGVQLKRENPQLRTERQRLYEICDLAASFFEKQLGYSAVGKEAAQYLLQRGITKESMKKWRLGYSPEHWNGLTDFLISQGYQRDEVVKAGLAIAKENNKNDSYDRFRGRIMFPVFDLNAQVIGFGGRVFKQADQKEAAKYINTPQTIIYDKGGILYGLHVAKMAVRKENQCVVTEGYTDVILCHQAGFENTVAASGTALTSQHLRILKRYSENLLLAFDMDVAGESATKRGIGLAQEQGFAIRIVEAGVKDADPADIVSKDPRRWQVAIDNAKAIMDYYVDSAFLKFDRSAPEGKKEIARVVLPAIKRIYNTIEQSHWIQKFSEMLGVKEEAVRAELAKISSVAHDYSVREEGGIKNETSHAPLPSKSRKNIIEERIIALVAQDMDLVRLIEDAHYEWFSQEARNILKEVQGFEAQNVTAKEESKRGAKELLERLVLSNEIGVELKNFLETLALRPNFEYEEDGVSEMKTCLAQLRELVLKDKLSLIQEEITESERKKDFIRAVDLTEKFNKLTRELAN